MDPEGFIEYGTGIRLEENRRAFEKSRRQISPMSLSWIVRRKDRLSKARRSWNMSRIRGRNTTPELIVRRLLHRMGYRFRLHGKNLPGRPDIVLKKYKTVIFVHGCFWHRHKGCKNCTTPSNRREWWLKKLNGNAARDRLHLRALRRLGWRALVVWECQTESGIFAKDLGSLLLTIGSR
jgi:DNA mismatch endonuclease (patch repair protein)